MQPSPSRISLPRKPQAPRLPQFPLLAFVAPIFAATMMWAVTRSGLMLVFAILGPVIALATMGDSHRRNRVEQRQHAVQFKADYAIAIHDICVAHDGERAELERETPGPSALIAAHVRDSERWRGSIEQELKVRLGIGRIASRISLDDDATAPPDSDPNSGRKSRVATPLLPSVEELRELARYVDNAPVALDARLGIGVCGPRAQAGALAASIVVQLASALSPADFELDNSFDAANVFEWVRGLPHMSDGSTSDLSKLDGTEPHPGVAQLVFRSRRGGNSVVVCVSEDEIVLPRECRVVVAVSGSRARVVQHPETFALESFEPDYVSLRQAAHFAKKLRSAALISFAQHVQSPPDRVLFRELESQGSTAGFDTKCSGDTEPRGRGHLEATIGKGSVGPVKIDLVAEGPHAIVAGTTGSGKSEVLVTWVLALASEYLPSEVNFLLIDFKGGAAFAPVQNLAHTVGVLTDLDATAAKRAILSLQAELRRREQILAEASARSIEELSQGIELPRLLIVVDEFAAMVSNFAELQDLFVDLAARGRSLGIHLILCTQRPSGSIRESILANCALRISLRVNNTSDSVAVVGIPDAARVPKHLPGRCILLRPGFDAETVQWAVSTEADALAITVRSQEEHSSVRRPWLDPLPNMLHHSTVESVSPPQIVFGLVDLPELQQQVPAVYDPKTNGNLFIVGCQQSGKSTALAALARSSQSHIWVPSSVEGAWDAVSEALSSARTATKNSLVLLDDLDEIVGKFSPEHELVFIERLSALMREGPRSGSTVVVTASSMRGRVQAISGLCNSTLVLRMRDRQDHILVGGEAMEFSSQLPAGRGFWNSHRVQVCFTELGPTIPAEPPLGISLAPGGALAVISSHPAAIQSELGKLGQVVSLETWKARQSLTPELEISGGLEPLVIIGDPDAWLSSQTVFNALRSSGPIAFHNCSPAEFRSLSRLRELPLPLDSPQNTAVLLHPDGRMQRAKLSG